MTWHRRFFWLLLVLLPTQLGYHVWPQWAMVLGRRVDYLSPTLYLTDIFVIATLVSWLFFAYRVIPASEPGSKEKKAGFRVKPGMTTSALVLLSFIFVNIFVATNPVVAIYKWVKVTEFVLLGWYIVRTKPSFSRIIFPLSLGVLYSSVLAIAQFLLQRSVGGPPWWLGERTFDVSTPGIARTVWYGREILRPYATFSHPNVLGGYIAALLPLVIHQFTNPTNNPIRPISDSMKKMYQWFLAITFVVGVVALGLTFSRSAIAVGAIAIALAIARIRNYELRIMGIGIVVLFLTSYFILHNSTEESVVVRQQLNDAAIKLWQTSPLLGVGLGNFLVRLPQVIPTRTIYFLQPVHNIYLLLLSEVGVVGIGLIVLWIVIQSQKWRVQSVNTLHFSLLTLLLLGTVDHYPLTLQQGQLLLTILIAISLSMTKSNSRHKTGSTML